MDEFFESGEFGEFARNMWNGGCNSEAIEELALVLDDITTTVANEYERYSAQSVDAVYTRDFNVFGYKFKLRGFCVVHTDDGRAATVTVSIYPEDYGVLADFELIPQGSDCIETDRGIMAKLSGIFMTMVYYALFEGATAK